VYFSSKPLANMSFNSFIMSLLVYQLFSLVSMPVKKRLSEILL